jgi:hypothetical protein
MSLYFIMSASCSNNPKTIDRDRHVSGSSYAANDGKRQADNEGRSRLSIQESSCSSLVVENSVVVGKEGEVEDSEMHAQRVGKEIDRERPSRGRLPYNLSNSRHAAKIGEDDMTDDNFIVVACDLPTSFSTGFTANESASPDPKERKEGMSITEHLNTRPVNVSCSLDFVVKPEHPDSKTGIKETVETLASDDADPPPVPFVSRSHKFEDGPKSKKNARIEIPDSIDDQGPPVPFSICFADAAITEKISRIDGAKGIVSDQAASSTGQQSSRPSAAELDYPNRDQALINPEIVQQSRSMRAVVDMNYGLNLPRSASQRNYTLPRADSIVLSQSVPNVHVQKEEEHEEFIFIPEAFLVESNSPMQTPDVGLAELIEPDRSRVSLKKRHACLVSAFIAVAVIALALTITSRGKAAYLNVPEPQSSSSSPSQSSVDQPTSQPTLSVKNEIETNILQRNTTFDEMGATDARVFALDWITNKDQLRPNASDPDLFQRYILVLLAYEFSNSRWLSDLDECRWDGVKCDKNGRVIQLELSESFMQSPSQVEGHFLLTPFV